MKEKFLGFERLDGTVGIRNHLLVMSITGLTGPIARKISLNLPGSLLIDNPYGSGILGEDRLRQDRAMIGFGNNIKILKNMQYGEQVVITLKKMLKIL